MKTKLAIYFQYFSISTFHSVENSGFSVIQILREINFGESRGSKVAIFAILGDMNFENW